MDTIIMIIIVVFGFFFVAVPRSGIAIQIRTFRRLSKKMKRRKKELPLAKLEEKLEFAIICAWDKAVYRLQAGQKGHYVELRRYMSKEEPSRNQMVLQEEVCGPDVLRKAALALKNKNIPYYLQKSDENNARTIVVECGRNIDLACSCAYAVLTEGFGIPHDGHCLQKEIGRFDPGGMGFGLHEEVMRYGMEIDIEELETVVLSLLNSADENAFVLFGRGFRKLPKLRKDYNRDGTISFALEYPVIKRRERNVIRQLEENGAVLNKIDPIVSNPFINNPDDIGPDEKWHSVFLGDGAFAGSVPTYLIPLGADTRTVSEHLKQILTDSEMCHGESIFDLPTKVQYRLSEFVTADWNPNGESANEATSGQIVKERNSGIIEFKCAQCEKPFKVRDEAAGKRGKCPQCGAVNVVPHTMPPDSL